MAPVWVALAFLFPAGHFRRRFPTGARIIDVDIIDVPSIQRNIFLRELGLSVNANYLPQGGFGAAFRHIALHLWKNYPHPIAVTTVHAKRFGILPDWSRFATCSSYRSG